MSFKRAAASVRNAIAGDFAAALAADFKEHGVEAIERLREKDVAAYLRLVAAIEPEEAPASPFAEVSDDELADFIAILKRVRASSYGQE